MRIQSPVYGIYVRTGEVFAWRCFVSCLEAARRLAQMLRQQGAEPLILERTLPAELASQVRLGHLGGLVVCNEEVAA